MQHREAMKAYSFLHIFKVDHILQAAFHFNVFGKFPFATESAGLCRMKHCMPR